MKVLMKFENLNGNLRFYRNYSSFFVFAQKSVSDELVDDRLGSDDVPNCFAVLPVHADGPADGNEDFAENILNSNIIEAHQVRRPLHHPVDEGNERDEGDEVRNDVEDERNRLRGSIGSGIKH